MAETSAPAEWTRLTALAKLIYGNTYARVPYTQQPFVRPGEAEAIQARWLWKTKTTRPQTLDEYAEHVPAGEIEEYIGCLLCGEQTVQAMFHPRKKGKWHYHAVRCPSCGFIYRNPNVKPERVGDLYAGKYSSFLTSAYMDKRRRRYELTLDSMSPVFDDGRNRRLLDFGCGVGLFLELAGERGFDLYGVDLSKDALNDARNRVPEAHLAFGDPTEDDVIGRGGFDFITMWSVLAHLARPHEDLTQLHGLLADDGALLILTVNAEGLLLKKMGSNWDGFTKNHLVFFGRDSVSTLLRQVGFEAVYFPEFYGDTIEAGTTRLPLKFVRRLKKTTERYHGGMMMRALAFKTLGGARASGLDYTPLV